MATRVDLAAEAEHDMISNTVVVGALVAVGVINIQRLDLSDYSACSKPLVNSIM